MSNSKLRPFYIAKMLYELTDEEHYLTTNQIIEILQDRYEISAHRQTVKADIDLLVEFGMDIQEIKSTQNRYNLVSRQFDNAELKLLIDAVESAKFIPSSKSESLVAKISRLGGESQANEFKRHVSVEGRIKANNDRILTIIDAINTAINHKKKISFQYFQYNVRKEKKLRRDGKPYVITPLHLVWNGDHYYMIGVYDYMQRIGSFRVDRIAKTPEILCEEAIPAPDSFVLSEYINSAFNMFSGETCEVELICDNSVMDSLIDRFGEDITTYAYDMKSFKAVVSIAPTHIFYSWVFGFEGLVKILSPLQIKQEFQKMVLSVYNSLE